MNAQHVKDVSPEWVVYGIIQENNHMNAQHVKDIHTAWAFTYSCENSHKDTS
jgi:hypothetical protein